MVALFNGNLGCVKELLKLDEVDLETTDNLGLGLEELARVGEHLDIWEVVREEQRRRSVEKEVRREKIVSILNSDNALKHGQTELEKLRDRHREEEREMKKWVNEKEEELLSERVEEVLREEKWRGEALWLSTASWLG